MDHQIAMRVLNCRAHRQKQLDAFPNAQAVLLTVRVHRSSFEKLHNEVRPAIVREAGFVEASNVWVIEPRKNPALVAKPAQHRTGIQPALENLYRDAAFIPDIVSYCTVHRAGATLANEFDDPVVPEYAADH